MIEMTSELQKQPESAGIPQVKTLENGFSSAFQLVDDVVLKNYITRLPEFSVVPMDKNALANNLGRIRLF